MPKIFLKPARAGLLIRFPENPKQILSQEGEYVEEHREWTRKITFGDVVEAESAEPKKIKTKELINESQSEGANK